MNDHFNKPVAAPHALVMGFFSTIGDIECLRVACRWLEDAHISYDIAPYAKRLRALMPGAVDARRVDARRYQFLIVVCGPCWPDLFKKQKVDLRRFRHSFKIGVNLTMVKGLAEWNPFDLLIERDSSRTMRPDISFLEPTTVKPVVGVCLAPPQGEYGDRQRHDLARRHIENLIELRNFTALQLDTRCLPTEANVMTDPSDFVSQLSRVDFLLTTRLHGMIYALKAGRPVIALDPIAGGDKVIAQSRVIGWPKAILAEDATAEWMGAAADWCYSADAQKAVRDTRARVLPALASAREEFMAAVRGKPLHATDNRRRMPQGSNPIRRILALARMK